MMSTLFPLRFGNATDRGRPYRDVELAATTGLGAGRLNITLRVTGLG